MALGKRPEGRQEELFVATSDIRRLSHPFYRALERLLHAEEFDAFAEETCRAFYAPTRGRPSIPPGVYFRMLLVGYRGRLANRQTGPVGTASTSCGAHTPLAARNRRYIRMDVVSDRACAQDAS